MRTEVAIIGGGVAGVTAALAARDAGRRTAILWRAPGATALSSGACDVARPAFPWADDASTRERIHDLVRSDPHHPYARLEDPARLVEEAIQLLQRHGLPLTGPALGEPAMALATELGTVHPAAFAQPTIAAGDLFPRRPAVPRRIIVVGLMGYSHASARATASVLAACAARAGRSVETTPVTVDWPAPLDIGTHPHELARALDSDEPRLALARAMERAGATLRADLWLLPPVLGLANPIDAAAALSDAVGAPCAELLAVIPGVPGLRLQRALEAAIEGAEIHAVRGTVREAVTRGSRVERLRVEGGEDVEAEAVVLASGKFIGGGLNRGQSFRETIFGLPVWSGAARAENVDVLRLTEGRPWERQAIFSVGLRTDHALRALDAEGHVAFENLHVTGSVMGGYDAVAGGERMGVAIATGVAAGRAAAGVGIWAQPAAALNQPASVGG